MPRLASGTGRYVLEEAQPGPTVPGTDVDGFADQQVNGAGPAPICTSAGTVLRHGQRTGASRRGQHFSERVQYMFHAPSIAVGNRDPYVNGGGPALLPDENRGPHYAERTAPGHRHGRGKRRMRHLCCLQRTSRAPDGTHLHIRMDGPGVDAMDVPDGAHLSKLQFAIFVPTAEFFRTLRTSRASPDLQDRYGVAVKDNGLDRFLTATRRQNFLVPRAATAPSR